MFSLYFATDSAPGCLLLCPPLPLSFCLPLSLSCCVFCAINIPQMSCPQESRLRRCAVSSLLDRGTAAKARQAHAPPAIAIVVITGERRGRGQWKGCCPCAEPEKLVSIANCRLLFLLVFCFSPIFLCLFRFFATLGKASKSCKRQQRNADQLSAAHRMPNAFRFCIPCKGRRRVYSNC